MTSGPFSGYSTPELVEKKRGLLEANRQLKIDRDAIRNRDRETSSQMAQLMTINQQEINAIKEELDARAARRADKSRSITPRSAR